MGERKSAYRTLRIVMSLLAPMCLLLFICSPSSASDPHSASYSADSDKVFWFIHISDVHIGVRGDRDSLNLEWVVTEAKDVINPNFIIVSGDLTDSTNGNWLGWPNGPYQEEWNQYKSILQDNNVDSSFYYDIPGNHDHYNDKYFSYYLANSIQGQATNQTQHSWVREFSFGKYHFLGINTADNTGSSFSLSWPYGDYAGLDALELGFIQTELENHNDANLTLIFGHHPLAPTGSSTDTYVYYGGDEFISFMDSYGSSLYGYGHTHVYSESFFKQNMTEGVFYFNVASLGKSTENNYTIMAIDYHGLSAVTQTVKMWPVVLITAPMDRYLGGTVNPYAYTVPNDSSNPIRALVFDKNPVQNVRYRIDAASAWVDMNAVSTNYLYLWEAFWDASTLAEGEHSIEVQASTPSGTRSDVITVYVKRGEPLPNSPPTAAFSYIISELAVSFTDDSTDPDGSVVAWSWNFGDGVTSTAQNPSHSYAVGGTYKVDLTVTDDDGATGSSTQNVTVASEPNTPPTVNITSPTSGATFESGTSILFSGWASDYQDGGLTDSLIWTSDNFDIGTGGSFSSVLSDGPHTITASVTDSGGLTGSASITITVESSGGGGFTLGVTAYKVRGTKYADLTWSGATSTNVDVYRDGNFITETANDGAYTDGPIGKGGGSATYQVCEEGTSTCSNNVSVTW
jgi:PKD repeat protein